MTFVPCYAPFLVFPAKAGIHPSACTVSVLAMDPRDKPEDDNCGEPNPLSDVILGLVPRIHYRRFQGDYDDRAGDVT